MKRFAVAAHDDDRLCALERADEQRAVEPFQQTGKVARMDATQCFSRDWRGFGHGFAMEADGLAEDCIKHLCGSMCVEPRRVADAMIRIQIRTSENPALRTLRRHLMNRRLFEVRTALIVVTVKSPERLLLFPGKLDPLIVDTA